MFNGSDEKSEVPVGLLVNLEMAQARSYCTDLMCSLPTSPTTIVTESVTISDKNYRMYILWTEGKLAMCLLRQPGKERMV